MADNSGGWTPRTGSDTKITVRISGLEDFARNMMALGQDLMGDSTGIMAAGAIVPSFGAGGLAEGQSFGRLHAASMKSAGEAMVGTTQSAGAFANSASYIASNYVDKDQTTAAGILKGDKKLPPPFADTAFTNATTDDVLNAFTPPPTKGGGGGATTGGGRTLSPGQSVHDIVGGGYADGGLRGGYGGGWVGNGRDRLRVPGDETGNPNVNSPYDGDPTENMPRLTDEKSTPTHSGPSGEMPHANPTPSADTPASGTPSPTPEAAPTSPATPMPTPSAGETPRPTPRR